MAALRCEMIELTKNSQVSHANNSARAFNAGQQLADEPVVVDFVDPARQRQDAEKIRKREKKSGKARKKRSKH
eukprot:3965499-Pleurochrysis_carterae.AAC.1